MPEKYVSLRNLQFLLHEVLGVEKLNLHPYYAEYTREAMDMVLESALQIGDNYLRPLLIEMDRDEPQLVNGKIKVHPGMKEVVRIFAESEWISAPFASEKGGMQLPVVLNSATGFIFNAANYSASVFPFLTSGAAGLILSFASEELQKTYLPKMFSGEWQGTMALTEPEAGSSLSDVITQAVQTEEGHFLIKGQKIYISCGDHDACENVIHLMLARIKGAPAGVKGISLFVVPQKRIENGQLVDNDLQTAGLFHKMGYKGAPIAHLMMGEKDKCRGWLVGEAHKGLTYMFQMMNEARIGVGMNATGIASAAYYASLEYAKERPQGRKINNKDLTLPQVPIIEHADVKRMLLFQKSVVEGSLALLLHCSYLVDLEKISEGEEKEHTFLLLDFLTPIAKSYPSEMGILSTSAAVQCLGGGGYLKDYNIEQFFRESRIHPIHEGTTGIHGIDLLGRKVTMHNGKAFRLFLDEIYRAYEQAKIFDELKICAMELKSAANLLENITGQLLGLAQQGKIEEYMADATLYLELTGIIAIAWQWLIQGTIIHRQWNGALKEEPLQMENGDEEVMVQTKKLTLTERNFYLGKLQTMNYFFEYELPKIQGIANRLKSRNFVTVAMQPGWFD